MNGEGFSSGVKGERVELRLRLVPLVALSMLALFAVGAASGCGGKPQFCDDRTTLQESVKSLPSAATSGGVSGLEAQITKVETDAKTLIDSAKSDFPSESSAIENALNQLKSSVSGLPEKPSTSQLAGIVINATAVVNAVNSFVSATDEECK